MGLTENNNLKLVEKNLRFVCWKTIIIYLFCWKYCLVNVTHWLMMSVGSKMEVVPYHQQKTLMHQLFVSPLAGPQVYAYSQAKCVYYFIHKLT